MAYMIPGVGAIPQVSGLQRPQTGPAKSVLSSPLAPQPASDRFSRFGMAPSAAKKSPQAELTKWVAPEGATDADLAQAVRLYPNLLSLDLSRTRISDIRPLVNLPKLRTLNLSFTPVSNIEPLANLSELRILNLSNTQVLNASPLATLTNLTALSLSDTPVNDLAVPSLKELNNLKVLALSKTLVSDDAKQGLRSALPKCVVT